MMIINSQHGLARLHMVAACQVAASRAGLQLRSVVVTQCSCESHVVLARLKCVLARVLAKPGEACKYVVKVVCRNVVQGEVDVIKFARKMKIS